jgi:hypothetical protein
VKKKGVARLTGDGESSASSFGGDESSASSFGGTAHDRWGKLERQVFVGFWWRR